MKKLFQLAKYNWHRFQYTKNKLILSDCKDEGIILKLEKKMKYHERLAIMNLAKKA